MYRIRRLFSALFTIMLGLQLVMAQYSVRGEVVDSTGVGEPYATIRIYTADDTTKVVKIGVTGEDGSFNQNINASGNYRISISSVGKKIIIKDFHVTDDNPEANLGQIVVHTDDNLLGEVEVVAQKPLVTAEIDRLCYDVQSDEDSKSNTILEMLKKVPMVTVDGQDNIKVNGSSNFKIYKNGRPDNTMSGNPSQVLKSIPANLVKKIEVITEPGAKYDAEGVSGILNIVMEDNRHIDGVMGSIYARYNTWQQPGGNIYLATSFKDKFTASVNYSYFNINPRNNMESENSYIFTESGNNEQNKQVAKSPGNFHYGALDMSYEIDTLNLITASVSGYYVGVTPKGYQFTQSFDSYGNELYYLHQLFDSGTDYSYYDISTQINYQHLTNHKDEAINFSYQLSSSGNSNYYISTYDELYNPPFDYTRHIYDTDQKLVEHTFQLDWTRPITEKHKLDFGAKYIFRSNHSVTSLQYDDQTPSESDFMHYTHVGAIYGEYSFTSGAWMARAGVRYEFSRMIAEYRNSNQEGFEKNLNDIVPTLGFGYRINEKNNTKLNFSTRINRPGMDLLDPAENESSTLIIFGNPYLVSARTNSVQGTYTFIHPKITLNASLGYKFSNNQITEFNYAINNIRYNTYDNIGKTRQAYMNLYIQWMPAQKTNISLNGEIDNSAYISNNLGIENRRWTYSLYVRLSQELPWKLRFGISGGRDDYGIDNLYSYYCPSYSYYISLQRSFLKDDRLTVQLLAYNPFSSKYLKDKSRTLYGDYTGYAINRYIQRFLQVSVSFRFGSLKTSVKETRTSISNDDIVGGGQRNTPSGGSKGD